MLATSTLTLPWYHSSQSEPLAVWRTELTSYGQLQLAAASGYSSDMLPAMCFGVICQLINSYILHFWPFWPDAALGHIAISTLSSLTVLPLISWNIKQKKKRKAFSFFLFYQNVVNTFSGKKEVCFILRMENKNISVQLVEDLRLR